MTLPLWWQTISLVPPAMGGAGGGSRTRLISLTKRVLSRESDAGTGLQGQESNLHLHG